jgi:hypothetical protein
VANRRITEFPAINGLDINEQDLLTLVHVFEVDPTLRNKKITFEQFKDYLNIYYASTSGTTFSGNIAISGNLTVSGLGSFGTILSSGLSTFSGIVVQNNAVVSGTVSGATITGANLQGVNVNATTVTTTTATGTTALFTSGQYQSLSGATITGGQGSFTSGTFVNLSGTSITGTTVAATTGTFQTLSTPVLNVSGNLSVASGLTVTETAQFAAGVQVTGTLSGTTVTGTTARFSTVSGVSGVFTTNLSGATITGNTVLVSNITGVSGVFTTQVSGATVTGNTGAFGNVSGISGVFTQFLSGAVITGDAGRFTAITGVSGVYTNLSGAAVTGDTVAATSITGVTGVFTSRISGVTVTGTTAAFTTISGVSGVFTTNLSGATITGDSVQASGLTAGTGNFVRVSGTTVTGDTGAFTNLTGIVGVFTTSVSGTTVISTTVTGATGTFTSLTGTTITGTTVNATTGVFNTLQAVNLSFTNTTVSGNLTVVGSGYFGSGVSVTGTISGITVTGTSGQFTNITADTANFTTATGVTASFTTITGVTVTGTTANFTSGNFVSFSGGTYIATSGVFASGTAANPSISILGDADTGVYSPGANQLAITTSGTGRLFVNSAGRVGIGTASSIAPSAPLDDFHIASTDPAVLWEETDAGTDEKYWRIRAEGSILRFEGINDAFNATTAWLNVTRTTGARSVDNIAFSTGTTERLRITSAGNVGIGTSIGTWTPGVTLDVRSGSNNTAVEEIAAFARPDALVRASINKGIVSGNGISFGTTTNHPLALRTNALERIVIGATGTTTLTSDASTAPLIVNISASEVARIDSSGRLLVGTSAARSFTAGAQPAIQIESATLSTGLGITTNRNDSACNVLHFGKSRSGTLGGFGIVSSGDAVGEVRFEAADGSAMIRAATIQAQVDGTPGANDMPGRLVLSTTADGASSPTERMRIDSSGRVGIGTTSPSALLDVNGTHVEPGSIRFFANATSFLGNSIGVLSGNNFVFTLGSTERARIDSSGRLLVGTSTARSNFTNRTDVAPALQVEGLATALGDKAISIVSSSSVTSRGAHLYMSHQLSGTIGGNTVLGNNNQIGLISFNGSDGSEFVEAATIGAFTDGTPGTDDMPGRLVLSTTADGASSPTERMRITSAGLIGIGATNPATLLHLSSATGSATPTPTELRIATTTVASDWSVTNPWGRISFYSEDGSAFGPKIHASIDATALTTAGGTSDIVFRTNNNTSNTLDARMVIKGDSSAAGARVGIGTTSPGGALEIQAAATIHPLIVQGPSSEFARIDSSGRLLVGTSTAYGISGLATPDVQLSKANQDSTLAVTAWKGDSNGFNPTLQFMRSYNNTTGTHTAVPDGARLGSIRFAGSDGTAFFPGAEIVANSDGQTWASGDCPGRLAFLTTADGASSTTERMRITSDGSTLIGTTSTSGAVSNTSLAVAGIFRSISGATASTASATPVTLFALPSSGIATYFLTVTLSPAAAASNYHATYMVGCSANTAVIQPIKAGTSLTVALSGMNVQATQTSGAAQVMNWSAVRMA